MKVDLWGNLVIRAAEYWIFHDESIPNKRWFLVGLTFVEHNKLDTVHNILRKARERENYFGEIHFSELPKSFGGEFGAKARVARRWMEAYQNELADFVYFSCLAVDRHSPAYDHRRFTQDFHAYNRFTAMALKAGIAWHLGPRELDQLTIKFVSDEKDRASRPDKGMIDNFEEYLPYRAELDSFITQSQGKKFPSVHLELQLKDSSSEDLLQFTDLLLGATQMALVAGSNRPAKRELAKFLVRWYQDTKLPPWEQELGLHRKFSVWAFPDDKGRPYNNLTLALSLDDSQLSLF